MGIFLDIALRNAALGFRVFPLVPKTKRPLPLSEGDHFDAATIDTEQIKVWAFQEPNANVGLSPDEHFCFLETDNDAALRDKCADLPQEVWDTTRVSARPDRCYYVFRQTMRTRKAGNMTVAQQGQPNLFEFKQHRLYVVGPGSIHEKTGKPYEVQENTIPAMPDVLLNRLCELYGVSAATSSARMSDDARRETDTLDRFLEHYEVATLGDWFNKGKQWYRPIECPWTDTHENTNQGTSTCIVYTEDGGYGFDCKHKCSAKTWKEFRAELELRGPDKKFSFASSEPVLVIGGKTTSQPEKTVSNWREHFHTKAEALNAPPITFLIKDFLQCEGVTGLAAPVRERKSLLALNIVHALLTGEKLFGHFEVLKKPERVLYFCPEVSLGPFTDRVKKIGLLDYVGETFFYRTMSSEGHLTLDDPALQDALPKSVVVLDTAIRFLEGDENSSAHIRAFADGIFALLRGKAEAVLLLHHSPKDTGDSMTLENAMRGSGDMGAFLASCWGTRLQDPTMPYESASFLSNLKQRDFESPDFEVTCGPDCRMHIIGDPATTIVSLATRKGKKANKDGHDDAAEAVIRANMEMPIRQLQEHLAANNIKRGTTWIAKARARMKFE